jgi:hypothetical protein
MYLGGREWKRRGRGGERRREEERLYIYEIEEG